MRSISQQVTQFAAARLMLSTAKDSAEHDAMVKRFKACGINAHVLRDMRRRKAASNAPKA